MKTRLALFGALFAVALFSCGCQSPIMTIPGADTAEMATLDVQISNPWGSASAKATGVRITRHGTAPKRQAGIVEAVEEAPVEPSDDVIAPPEEKP